MPYSDEFCLIHGYTLRYDRRSGMDVCDMCETGVVVYCKVCGLRKKPVGRSAPLEMANSLCDFECPGYEMEPKVGELWPGETREEFGY